ncbi:MAG: EAL domain-containing protein, partial [Gammaproteobacteria bacterium]|nr:EAL domain-containing protein [Gammaproteobacteria bacterium]NIU05146.1 EAL domain-containing protein [Gammaproteobacteria bacterium]NIV51983.1 EAL domain-containing protein [Gammaproteobacteria bacterium]NIX86419.1 EAL domain-containing protein [Gammaproteobacteria bacterium]
GKHTIAEGIETMQQLDFFAREGCDAGQGYYISKPLSDRMIGDWLAAANSKGWRGLVAV